MIKKAIMCVLAITPFVAFAQQDFNVKGEVGKINSPAKVFLIYNNAGQRMIDSAEINAGVFNFKGSVSEPEQAILVLDHEGAGLSGIVRPDMTQLYLEKGNVLVNAKDSLSNAVLSGTSLNLDQQRLNVLLKETDRSLQTLVATYTNATEEEKSSEDFVNKIKGEFDVVAQEAKALRFKFIKENPNSFVSLMTLIEAAGLVSDPNEILPLLADLSPELQEKPQAKAFASQLEMAINPPVEAGVPQVGAMAPEFTQNDTTGTPVRLASFRGKYVLLDFWASWCGPCRQENPNLVSAYNKYKDKNFTILGVSLDRSNGRDSWLKAISDDKLAWTQVSDLKFWDNEVARQYGIRSIPQSYLIDPEGRIVAANLRGEALHEKLAELLD
jgi:peroxiredoxin